MTDKTKIVSDVLTLAKTLGADDVSTTTPIGDLNIMDEDLTGVFTFNSEDNKEILRMERNGTLTLGEGLSQDEATQETARILKNFYEQYMGNTRTPPEGYREYAEIYIGFGLLTKVDWEDFDLVKKYKWNSTAKVNNRTVYAQAWDVSQTPRKRLRMHKLILPCDDGFVIDHINGDGLDNRKKNMRIVTIQQNSFNQSKQKGSSKYKGVSLDKETTKWRAGIRANGIRYNLGRFHCEIEAAMAYDRAAIKYHKEHAKLNFDKAMLEAAKGKDDG